MVQNYYKRNYDTALVKISPEFYSFDDVTTGGEKISPTDGLINSHISIAASFSSLVNVSATTNISGINTFDGISQYFYPKTNLTDITPEKFSCEILQKFGKDYSSFNTSSEFQDYLETAVLPNISTNNPSALLFDLDSSASHEHLVKVLGWGYLLNTSSVQGGVDPSSLLAKKYTETVFVGKRFGLVAGLEVLEEFVWTSWPQTSSVSTKIIPPDYVSGTGLYTSGSTQLEKLKTLIEVVYNENSLGTGDTYLEEVFELYSSVGELINDTEPNGPFTKLLKAVGFFLADRNTELEDLKNLFDIEKCKEEYLINLADLIGWKLIGSDPNRWRSQLRTAVEIYKSKGTIKSIQLIADTIFGTSVLDISSTNIIELYESYIPNLIFYALATDSKAFGENGKNWTEEVASFLGVEEYSTKGVDFNMRLAVDYILLDIFKTFPDLFRIGNEVFDLDNPEFVFNYRDRDFPIPPWEEEKFYNYCQITPEFLVYLGERLICFGVSEELTDDLLSLILNFTIKSTKNYSAESQWVFFTEDQKYATNYDSVLSNPEVKRVDYLPLWSGKSSSIALPFFASSFDFSIRKSNEPDSAFTLHEVAEGIEQVLPANVIANLALSISGVVDVVSISDLLCPVIVPSFMDVYEGSSQAYTNRAVSGADMSPGTNTFRKREVDDLDDTLQSTTSVINVPRNSLRRRNFQKLLPKNGFFDRIGFNMPSTWAPSALEYSCSDASDSCYIPLGFNFSAGGYYPVVDPLNPSGVWSICADLNSSGSYFYIDTSNTFPIRGRTLVDFSGCDEWTVRDTANDILMLMWSLIEAGAGETAKQEIAKDPSSFEVPEWADHQLSTTNAITNLLSLDDNYMDNFEFGKDVHQLHRIFSQHYSTLGLAESLTKRETYQSIINHTYGSIIYNSLFKLDGSAITTDPTLITSSLGEVNFFTTSADNVFTPTGSSIGSIYTSAVDDIVLHANGEYRNQHIVSGVDLIMEASGTVNNQFAVIKVDPSFERSHKSSYHIDNPMIYLRNVIGLQRIKFDLDGPIDNFLLPENDYKFDIGVFGARDNGLFVGGYEVGVWIHTEVENGKFWTLTNKGSWEWIDSGTTQNKVISEYSNIFSVPETIVDTSSDTGLKCVDFKIIEEGGEVIPQTLQNLVENEIQTFTIGFNTNNLPICVPREYYNTYGQVHRKAQSYIVEVFMLPKSSNSNRFMVVDFVNLYNSTMNSKASSKLSLGVAGNSTYDPSTYLDTNKLLTPSELLILYRFFKLLQTNFASRDSSISSGVFETSGGGRLNYRVNPDWAGIGTVDSGGEGNYTLIDLDGV